MGVLDGIRVIEWASWLSVPSTASMLGDLGADVVKIEDPIRGDPVRGMQSGGLPGGRTVAYETVNRNKRGLTLNLGDPEGQRLLHRLVSGADVFLTSYSRRLTRAVAADYATLRQHNGQLIYGYGGSGWGPKGPDSDRRAYDVLMQGISGLMWSTGDARSGTPATVTGGPIDMASGMSLGYAVLAALFARERGAGGQEVTSSLLGIALHLQALNVNTTLWTGKAIDRFTDTFGGPLLAYYRCADSQWIIFCEPQLDRYWPEFCAALELDRDEADEALAQGAARELIEARIACEPRSRWLTRFEELTCKFAYGPVNTMEEATSLLQAAANDYVTDIEHPTLGPSRTLGFPFSFSESECSIRRPACEFGEHSEEILLESCDVTWEDIAGLRKRGVIG
ncbi:MAG: CoA transferase [Deltaproteobacteria bacterium]|nr:CoA transferase [Deltaproteobacteria bacterium]